MNAREKSPLYKRIAEEIAAKVRDGSYKGSFIPGESEICREYGASRITIRGALKILEEAGLLEAIPGKGRRIAGPGSPRPRPGRRQAKASKKLRINCAVQDSKLQAYQLVVNLINNMAMDDDFRFSVHFVGENYDQSSFERVMRPEESDGIVCIGVGAPALLSKIESCGVPAVHVNSSSPLVRNAVATDDFAGGYMIGSHLARHGHNEILLIKYPVFSKVFGFKSRELGLLNALQERFGDGFKVESVELEPPGDRLLAKALDSKSRPKAAFMLSDILSANLFGAMEAAGLKMPRDLSVAGFDNMLNTADEWKRDVDSIDQPWAEIGAQSYNLLRQLMEQGPVAKELGRKILLRPSLILKGSVLPKA